MIVRFQTDTHGPLDVGIRVTPIVCDDDGVELERLAPAVLYGVGESVDVRVPHSMSVSIEQRGQTDVCAICLLPNCRREHRECSPPRPQPTTHGDTP